MAFQALPSGQHFIRVMSFGQIPQGTSEQALAQLCFLTVSVPKLQLITIIRTVTFTLVVSSVECAE